MTARKDGPAVLGFLGLLVKFSTVNGAGEAIKDPETGIWTINAPEGSERFAGDKRELKARIRELKIAAIKDQ